MKTLRQVQSQRSQYKYLANGRLKSLILIFILPGLSLLASSCAYYHEKNPGDPNAVTAETVSWQRVSNEFFQPRCAICHGQGGANVNVSNYDEVVRQITRIQEATLQRTKMPPDSPLTEYEKKLLTVWIENNTPYEATGNSSSTGSGSSTSGSTGGSQW